MVGLRPSLPLLLTMPAVTVWSMPSGLPTASTHSPISTLSESPRRAATRLAGGFSSRTTATSVSSSLPITLAGSSLPSENTDLHLGGLGHHVAVGEDVALGVEQHARAGAAPGARAGDGAALAPEVEEALEEVAHVGLAAAARGALARRRCATRGSSTSTSSRTTLGRSALATLEKARDSDARLGRRLHLRA